MRNLFILFSVSFLSVFFIFYFQFPHDRPPKTKKIAKIIPLDCNREKIIGLHGALAYLNERCGYTVKNVLDIGANNGQWSLDLRNHVRNVYGSNPSFFLVEGSSHHSSSLKQTGFAFVISLVADVAKEVKFYRIAEGPRNTGNSIYPEVGWGEENAVKELARPIDEIISDHNIGPFNFMKIDVQGAELLALLGAKKTLLSLDVLLTEVSIMNYNSGGATYFEIHSLLDKLGFAAMDIVDLFRYDPGNGFAVQMDVLWVRKSSYLWSRNCTGFPRPKRYEKR